jgi:hypothetical protein
MVYQPERYLPIPNIDLLSWIFGNVDYNQDKAVSITICHSVSASRVNIISRSTSMPKIPGGNSQLPKP